MFRLTLFLELPRPDGGGVVLAGRGAGQSSARAVPNTRSSDWSWRRIGVVLACRRPMAALVDRAGHVIVGRHFLLPLPSLMPRATSTSNAASSIHRPLYTPLSVMARLTFLDRAPAQGTSFSYFSDPGLRRSLAISIKRAREDAGDCVTSGRAS